MEMTDTQIVDWMQNRFVKLAEDGFNERRFTLEYIDREGGNRKVYGPSLRECIRLAALDLRTEEGN